MKRHFTAIILIAALAALSTSATAAPRDPSVKMKETAVASVEGHRAELIDLSDRIWGYAEPALRETRSAEALAAYAEAQGFRVERGLAGMPTAFVASFGEGRPVIGILGEYDALPGLSQKVVPSKDALEAGAPGHGCGHNLLGAGAMGAAVAVKELIAAGRLKGTVRFYGTPAEEAVGGKVYMVREGVFKDLDACLTWHPADETAVGIDSSQALVDFTLEFTGRTAHAAADPWNGRSAVAALELFTAGLNRMREFVKPTVRMHYAILDGGDVPNVVPAHAKLWCWLRDSKGAGVEHLLARVRKIAEGAALMAEAGVTLTVRSGDWETLDNLTGAKLMHANLQWLGPVVFSPEEQEFAKSIQKAAGVEPAGLDTGIPAWRAPKPDPDGGSTDVGDVSWVAPMITMSVTTAPKDAPWHAWPVVACSGMSIGHKGLLHAAKAMAATAVDLMADAKALQAVQAEFRERTKGVVYKPFIPDGPPPVPKTP